MENVIRIGICDDVEADQESLHKKVQDYFLKHGVSCKIDKYSCGENLVAEYEEGAADFSLLFLDIYMPGISGMEVAYKIREQDSRVGIAFTTTSPDFAVMGYDVNAMGYLLKPISEAKLHYVLENFMRRGLEERHRCILLRSEGKQIRVFHREIIYVESMRRELIFHLTDGSCIRTYGKLDDLEEGMKNHIFLRCHQSYLANIYYIRCAGDGFVMNTGETLPIRKRGQKAIKDIYFRYLVEQTLRGQ